MAERPEQLPEGRLIAVAQKRARLSGRKAADLAGMSEGHWRAIVSGSRSISKGVWVPVRGPADTIARMAQVVGATPEQLDEVGRGDAAEELRQLQPDGQRPARTPMDEAEELIAESGEIAAELLERARRMDLRRQRALLEVARAMEVPTESVTDGPGEPVR